MNVKQIKQQRRTRRLTLGARLVPVLALGLLLFGQNIYAQTKPKLPQKPLPHSKMARVASYDYVPIDYEQVGTTDLCYQQKGSSIDVQGYFNGSWYRSTFSDVGYKVAISVTTNSEEGTEDKVISGSYIVNSWCGYQKYWYNGEYLDEYYIADNYFNATLVEKENNVVTLTNFATFGGSITGIIDKESHTIKFPAQTFYMEGWEYDAIFCKQTDEFITNPSEETASTEVVATYDDEFNITMNEWCTLISMGDERYVYTDNTVSMSKNTASSDGTYTTSCSNGEVYNGVLFSSYVEQQGELARVCYSLTNTNEYDVVISMGTHADVMIGDNDAAPIERRKDQLDNTYGLTMKDGYGAQLCVLFGAGLAGVSKVDDFWFGGYWLNSEPNQMIGNYSSGDYYMVENGSYDSGMGWCWKNRTIPAGATVVYSYLIGVGDVRLEPNSSFEVTPDDPEGWNDLSRPHKLTLNGEYESPAGIDGMIEYAVEDSEEWKVLTDMLASGEEFTAELVAMFDPGKESHTIRFRTVDAVGNTTMLTPVIYKDVYYHEVSGIENKVYHYGDSIYQTNLTCDLSEDQYIVNEYQNNVNAGTATFMVQGVFPMTIGRRTYSFDISPLALEGGIALPEDNFVYNGSAKCPEWLFTTESNNNLVEDVDYTVAYKNNLYPGEGTIEVTGKRNYTGTLTAFFNIDKAQLSSNLYEFTLPNNDISYDGESHSATMTKAEGVGDVVITYMNTEDSSVSTEAPANVGSYDIYAEFADGTLYYGKPNEKIGSFSIYHFDDNEWLALNALNTQLQENGWTTSWNIAAGPVAVSKFEGLVIEQGHVVGINFNDKNLTDIPSGIIAFSQLKSVDLSHNNLAGNAGLLAAQLPNLTSLNLSYNQFSDLYPMISPNVTSLDISHQTIDRVVPLNLSEMKIEDIATTVPSILLYDHENQTYDPSINLLCTTGATSTVGDEDWAMQLAVYDGNMTLPYVSPNNAYHGESGDVLNVFDMKSGSSFKIALNFNKGDANFVGGIDATDLQATILYAFGGYRNYPFNFTAADTYKDDNINVQDVICTVNIILAQSASQAKTMRKSKSLLSAYEAEAFIYMQDGKVVLYSDKPVAAMSLKALGDITWKLEEYGMTQAISSSNVVGYSLSGMTLPVGETVIGTYTGNASITDISLADAEAQAVSVALSENTVTGIEPANESLGEDAQFFDITGRKVNGLNKGVNIKKIDSKTIKVVNK